MLVQRERAPKRRWEYCWERKKERERERERARERERGRFGVRRKRGR